MKKVAQLAGTSTATVSHVVNGTRFVSDETKAKVQAAMKQLNYVPNLTARNLRRQKTNIIGLILPDVSNFFFTSVIQGIEVLLRKHGYQLLVSNSDELLTTEIEQIQTFNAQLVQGIIIASSAETYADIHPYLNEDMPIVFIDRKPIGVPHDVVAVDNKRSVFEAITYLIDLNRKEIGIIAGIPTISTTKERVSGYRNALKDHNMSVNDDLIKFGDSQFQSGYDLARNLYEKNHIDAVFVANNFMTIGAMAYFKEQGVKVPKDVALIGFDDYQWAVITEPSLSLIKQPATAIGEKAAALILDKLENPNRKATQHLFETELIIRESC